MLKEQLIYTGKLTSEISWDFYLAQKLPDHKLTTAVSCLVLSKDREKVLLINNVKRGWEFPGGHIESGEDWIMAARREVAEESGYTIRDPMMFAYQALVSSSIEGIYPPISFIVYCIAYLEGGSTLQLSEDVVSEVFQASLFSLDKAKDVMHSWYQIGILDHYLETILKNI